MPDRSELPLITRSRLIHDLKDLGLEPGQTVMLHASVKAIGWIVRGPDVGLDALLEVLTATGTLMMYAGWEEDIESFPSWSQEKQAAYLGECPPFDPDRSRAHRTWSILTEYLRTCPGAYRSANPGASVAAIGNKTAWITRNHPLQYGYGPGSPLARLCEAQGMVLLLGAPLNSITSLHCSEHMAQIASKRKARYRVPLRSGVRRVWVDVEEFDTADGIVDWDGEDYFTLIARQFLAAGSGRSGIVGAANSQLLPAKKLHEFAVRWMEKTFTAGKPTADGTSGESTR